MKKQTHGLRESTFSKCTWSRTGYDFPGCEMNVHLNRCMLKNHPLKEREKQRGDFGRMSSLMTDTHIYWLAMISLSILNVCVCVCVYHVHGNGFTGSGWVFIPVNSSSIHTPHTHTAQWSSLQRCQPESIQNTHTFSHRIFSYYSSLTCTPSYTPPPTLSSITECIST